jgi:hypothetical protein
MNNTKKADAVPVVVEAPKKPGRPSTKAATAEAPKKRGRPSMNNTKSTKKADVAPTAVIMSVTPVMPPADAAPVTPAPVTPGRTAVIKIKKRLRIAPKKTSSHPDKPKTE